MEVTMKVLKKSLCLLIVAVMLLSVVIGTMVSANAAAFTIQRQWDSKWKTVYVGGRTMYNTACGIFSIVNAVGYLTGNAPDVYSVAVWANSIGAFNTASFGGTDRSTLYPRIQAKYGSTYGFTCDVAGGSGYWATAASTTLKNHLKNGGVAIGHVPGHFIAIVGYDASTNKFHVYDSAPSTSRGTATYGATGLGDCWVTQSRLSTGKLDLDWFCLLSATKAPVNKASLRGLLNGGNKVSHKDYNTTTLQELRVAYDAAVVVSNNSSATQSEVDTAAKNLLNALLNTSAKNVLSVGKSYTSTGCSRTDDYSDDGAVLTDGAKGKTDGGTTQYAGFQNTAEIIIDLGSVQKVDTFTAYMAAGSWGIAAPTSACLEAYVSTDKNIYTKAASTSVAIVTNGTGTYDETWSNYRMTATSDKQHDARYVKIVIKNYDGSTSQHIWLDEVEVSCYTGAHITDAIYISGINSKVAAGETKIFTSAFNNGVISSSYDAANIAWTMNVVAKKNSDGSYTVKSVAAGDGTAASSYTLASDEILIAAHSWEDNVDDPIGDSADNFKKLGALQVGDSLYLSGINTDYSFINIGAFVSTDTKNGSGTVGGSDVEQLVGGKTFWLTHYNDSVVEGAGVIITESYSGAVWWLHVAFAPTSIPNVYEITAISDGTDIGDGEALSIPAGGFVYAVNYGNDYPSINADGSGTDYTSEKCTAAIIDALTWKVGDKLKISGIDTVNKTIPTSTAGKKWYDDSYVCTANYIMYDPSANENPDVSYDTTVYDNMLWLTHFNDLYKEGAGAIVTDPTITGTQWNDYFAFTPVEGTNMYEITAISRGMHVGTSTLPALPEGGFIYSLNPGNDYPTLNQTGDTAGKFPDLPDYTSENCFTMVSMVEDWQIGDRFVFGNLDLNGKTIPTTTASKEWYEEGYVCTATFQKVVEEEIHEHTPGTEASCTTDQICTECGEVLVEALGHTPGEEANCTRYQTCTVCGEILANSTGHKAGEWVTLDDGSKEQRCTVCNELLDSEAAPAPSGLLGDINLDGAIDQYDYILVKRHYFETRYLTDDEMTRADVNLDGAINQYDYILIKRHYFGTYVIEQ